MAIALSTPVTGAAQTGFTTPGYVHAVDQSPDFNAKQYAVTSVTGTQTGVTPSTVASPFVFSWWKPKVFRYLGKPNPTTGLITSVPRNVWKGVTVKGVTPLAGQPYQNLVITTTIEVPAGSDTADAPNIRGALSMHLGSLTQLSAGIGDTCVSGVM